MSHLFVRKPDTYTASLQTKLDQHNAPLWLASRLPKIIADNHSAPLARLAMIRIDQQCEHQKSIAH